MLKYNSYVYSCLLDASKAFDLVHYGKLFKILISKDLPKSVIRLYFDNYLRQIYCVIWRDYKSEYFNVSSGVKQGGVISHIFFSLYIDPLLLALSKSQIGCHMNNVYIGALSYANDITIIWPSIRGLNKMLKICNEFAQSNKTIFNREKTYLYKIW